MCVCVCGDAEQFWTVLAKRTDPQYYWLLADFAADSR